MNLAPISHSMQVEGEKPVEVGGKPANAGPQRTARVLLLAFTLGVCDLTYWQYSILDRFNNGYGYWKSFVDGAGLAPEQYRIGVKLASWWMVQHFGWGFRHGFTLIDVVSSLAAVFLLYDLLQRRSALRAASVEIQWFASAAFVALTCFYLIWAGSYFRPETLPNTGLVAIMLWLWTSWDRIAIKKSGQLWVAIALVAASAVQGWIRADLACALNAGIFVGCLAKQRTGRVQHAGWKLAVSLLCTVVAGLTQLYIMRVKYPHTSYGPIPVLMIKHDLRQPLTFPPFLCFMLPIAWTYFRFWRDRDRGAGEDTDLGLVIGSMIYMILWLVLGKLDEVRIFIPFAMALIPLTVELAMRRIRSPILTGEVSNTSAACGAGTNR
jgi:hypothetical protein